MAAPFPRILVSSTRKTKKALLAAAAVVMLLGLACHETLCGVLCRSLPWKEDSFVGKPISELEKALAARGQSLLPMDASSLYALTDKSLTRDQQAMSFLKGKDYSWFHRGTAQNIGYVIIEKTNGARIIEILHRRSVDSL
jgi:hypothetical protein